MANRKIHRTKDGYVATTENIIEISYKNQVLEINQSLTDDLIHLIGDIQLAISVGLTNVSRSVLSVTISSEITIINNANNSFFVLSKNDINEFRELVISAKTFFINDKKHRRRRNIVPRNGPQDTGQII